MASAVSSSSKIDFTNYQLAYSDLPISEFPLCLQETVTRMRALFAAKDSLCIDRSAIMGSGGTGTVLAGSYEFENKKRTACAIKLFTFQDEAAGEANNLWLASGVDHAVRLHGVFLSSHYKEMDSQGRYFILDANPKCEESNRLFFVVIDLFSSNDRFRSTLKIQEISLFAKQLFTFLSQLQTFAPNRSEKMIHGDLMPSNMFWVNKQLTVIDFNLSSLVTDKSTPVVTQSRFRAPEIFLNQMAEDNTSGEKANYDEKIDVWSAGACIHYLYTGHFLFTHYLNGMPYGRIAISSMVDRLGMPRAGYLETAVAVNKFFDKLGGKFKLKSDPILFRVQPLKKHYQSQDPLVKSLKDFVSKCLQWDPKDRISVAEALQHPLLNLDREPAQS
jgi:serine/threonine protein kinase